MDSMEDHQCAIRGLNARLKGFLEQMNRLQETNMWLKGQIADWGVKNASHLRDWSQEENTVNGLRAQVGKLLMENAQLALQSDSMKSRAAVIHARCESEERQTKRLEKQVALLRESKRKTEEENVQLEADLWRCMTELQQMNQDFQQQQQQTGSCDALLVTATTAGEEEDGRGMELTQLLDQIRAQCRQLRLPDPTEGSPGTASTQIPGFTGPSESGAKAAASSSWGSATQTNGGVSTEEEAAWVQLSLGGAALREARAELTQARKQWQSLQVEVETLHALEKGLEGSLLHTQQLYSSQLQDLAQVIGGMESELEQVRGGLASQRQRHRQLLNTKMRLEHEIATYRRLLEREEGRYMSGNGQGASLQPWRGQLEEPRENGLENEPSDPAVTPDEPKSEPLPDIPLLHHLDNGLKRSPTLPRQQSLVILTEPERDDKLQISTVKTQEILHGNVVRESAEGHGTVETEKIDKVIKQWEGSFFKGNPKLRKKSVSLRFDLHMAAADEGCAQTKQDSLPDVEVRLVMKRSRSIPTIT